MVTGARRGELCALRWSDVDLAGGRARRPARASGSAAATTGEKDTKNHQKRRIALDAETVGILAEHLARAGRARGRAGRRRRPTTRSCSRESRTARRTCCPTRCRSGTATSPTRLGIDTTLHKLRHYSATELIAAGVDPRTVAGRLGHGGGGTTTLRYYSAWVSESDQRAASTLRARMPSRSTAAPTPAAPRHPYLKLAALLRERIAAGAVPVGEFLPGQKVLAAEHGVSVGTAHRAVSQLAQDGLVEVVPGHGFRVVSVPAADPLADEPVEPMPRRNHGAARPTDGLARPRPPAPRAGRLPVLRRGRPRRLRRPHRPDTVRNPALGWRRRTSRRVRAGGAARRRRPAQDLRAVPPPCAPAAVGCDHSRTPSAP